MIRPLRFLHTADIHLDAPHKYLNRNFQRRQEDFRQTLLRMQEIIIQKQIPLWFIAGDLWEHNLVTPPTISFLQKLFTEIPETHIFISPGNHDPIKDDSYYLTAAWPDNVTIFSSQWEAQLLEEWDVWIYGIGFQDPQQTESPLTHFPGKKMDKDRKHILVLHGSVYDGEQADDHIPYAPMALQDLEKIEMDYIALGHIHKGRIFYDSLQKVIAAYPGSPESIRSSETGVRHVLIGEWVNDKFRLTSQPIQTRLYREVFIDLSGINHYEEVRERINNSLSSFSPEEMFKVYLRGEISRYLQLDREFLDTLAEGYFYIQWVNEMKPDYDIEQLKGEHSLISLFLQKIEEKLQHEVDPEVRDEIVQAQYIILDALLRKEVNL